MQFQTLIVLGLAATQAVAYKVSCWKSGPTVSLVNIQNHIGTVCEYLKSDGYRKGEHKDQCIYDDDHVRWNFALTNIGKDDGRPIDKAECENGMNKQIQCEFGGETSYGNWKYRADPNYGDC